MASISHFIGLVRTLEIFENTGIKETSVNVKYRYNLGDVNNVLLDRLF